MKKLPILFCLVALGLFVFSCGDDDSAMNPVDETAPVVNISAPADLSYAMPGDTIDFGFTVSDDVALSSIDISGTLGVTQSITTFDTDSTHAINGTIAINPATPIGDQTIVVTGEDTSGNIGEATTTVVIQ